MGNQIRRCMKSRAINIWNDTRSISKVAGACACSESEARVYLSTQTGYPGEITRQKPKVKLTANQAERPDVPVTLPALKFLDPASRLPGERT